MLAPYRDIRDRDSVKERRFIAEGEVVVRHLLETRRFRPISLLLDEARHAAMAAYLASMAEDVPVLVASRSLLAEIAGFHVHRGCLAAVERGVSSKAEDLLPPPPQPASILVAAGIANHDNLGGIFRNAAAFGVDAVLLDERSCDPLYRKAVRVSVGAALSVPFARMPIQTILDHLERVDITPIALSPAGASTLNAVELPMRTALIVGAEGPGLADDVLSRCQTVGIAMAKGWDSLNVATATGIALHHLASRRLLKTGASP
jgi:tRNA G18 (ribose-2'-O)-methylase SpoU